MLEQVGKHPDAERNEHITQEMELRHSLRFARFDDGTLRIRLVGRQFLLVVFAVFIAGAALELGRVVLLHHFGRVFDPAELVGDEKERDEPKHDEHHRLHRVRPRRTAHPAEENIHQHDHADDARPEPKRNTAVGRRKRLRERAARDVLNHRARAHHADQQVRNHQSDENRKQQETEFVRLEPVAEELYLSDIAVALAERPELDPDQEEAGRVYDTRRRGQFSVDADAGLERLAAAADKCERRHRRAKQRHDQKERADRTRREKIIRRGAAEPPVAHQTQRKQHEKVCADDPYRNRAHYSPPSG